VITVSGLEVGATWQYSISDDNGFVDGTGSNFMLTNNTTYEANTILTVSLSCANVCIAL
jgi:hypothetical protein